MNVKKSLNELIKYYQNLIAEIKEERGRLQIVMAGPYLNNELIDSSLERWQNLEMAANIITEKIKELEYTPEQKDSTLPKAQRVEGWDEVVLSFEKERKLIRDLILFGIKDGEVIKNLLLKDVSIHILIDNLNYSNAV
ncbi:hypothetical protein [Parafilimonas terrae]|uniref:Uncharacterized protein n=1 Tax=Parafilimonas terrae TaxID=1465490 RepID=A0A1I5UB13_9BACT|nr:hypothetical protein [Parafilimonas terrae]SFP92395.1 hypothetical protein SAMN05444277_103176 [Parafilimonas terrae]